MKLTIASYDPHHIGGGWTFQNNFVKGLNFYTIDDANKILTDYDQADIYLIAGASMVSREEVDKAKADGKKVVLRVDNLPRRSRNRRWVDEDGLTKIQYIAQKADLVIYQSLWAAKFLYPLIKVDGPIILNGVDLNEYNSDNRLAPDNSYLYARSSRDEGKQWIMAWYWFCNNPGRLEIAGKFSRENIQHNFDFVNNERWVFSGHQSSLIKAYKRNRYFLYTYLNDACSNTLIEARASGMEIIDVYGMLNTGGAPEVMQLEDLSLERMTKEYLKVLEEL